MSRATAMAEAKHLKAIMERHGVRCSIELQPGRPWSGDQWYSRKYGIMNHHTAGSRKGDTPSLALCKRGRTGIPGPLCNGYGGRDLVYRIITLGLANHPGQGGPLVVSGVRIPRDSARPSMWGTEWEHDGVTPWPPEMRVFMAKANAALLEWLGRPIEASIEHSTWAPTRKIDRFGYTANSGQAEIRKWKGEDDVSETDVTNVLRKSKIVRNLNGPDPDKPVWTVVEALEKNDQKQDNQGKALKTLAAQVKALTASTAAVAAAVEGMSPTEVRAVLQAGLADLREAIKGIDVTVEVKP